MELDEIHGSLRRARARRNPWHVPAPVHHDRQALEVRPSGVVQVVPVAAASRGRAAAGIDHTAIAVQVTVTVLTAAREPAPFLRDGAPGGCGCTRLRGRITAE